VGTLYIVATPIGNLEDITYRAVRILGEVDRIAAEDTRHTRKLLNRYGIRKPLTSYFEGNRVRRGGELVGRLAAGESVALVSDAGTPGISDPGFDLIDRARIRGIPVVPVPGACAALAALSASGFRSDRFVFHGFLPRGKDKKRRRLAGALGDPRTQIFYESPRRLIGTLGQILDLGTGREVAVVRELTKIFEEVVRGSVEEVLEELRGREIKGEVTLLVGAGEVASKDGEMEALVEAYRREGSMTDREVVDRVTRETGMPRRSVYRFVIEVRKREDPSADGDGPAEKMNGMEEPGV